MIFRESSFRVYKGSLISCLQAFGVLVSIVECGKLNKITLVEEARCLSIYVILFDLGSEQRERERERDRERQRDRDRDRERETERDRDIDRQK